jgi:hypothetical protein
MATDAVFVYMGLLLDKLSCHANDESRQTANFPGATISPQPGERDGLWSMDTKSTIEAFTFVHEDFNMATGSRAAWSLASAEWQGVAERAQTADMPGATLKTKISQTRFASRCGIERRSWTRREVHHEYKRPFRAS